MTRSSAVLVIILLSISACDRKAPTSAPAPTAQTAPHAHDSSKPPPPPAAIPPRFAEISARADEGLDFASYLKPREKVSASVPRELAPLMAFQVGKEKEKTPPERLPYAVHTFNRSEDTEADPPPPTLYYISDQDKAGNESLTRASFVWFILDDEKLKGADSAAVELPYVAVSLTLDKRGTPVIARVRQSGSNIDRYFVTEALENAARQEHGAALKDRRYSIERAVNAASDSGTRENLVPKLISSVPEPSGPWVYVGLKDGLVTNVHCRCSASQTRAFTETIEFDIRPISDVPASIKLPDLSDPTSNALRLPTAIP